MSGETCIRRRVEIDGDNVYVIVGHEFATVTGAFENRPDCKPMSCEGARKVNEVITELLEELDEKNN